MSRAGPGNGRPLVVTIKDEAEQIAGGLWGATDCEWLFTQLLVVPQAHRGTGMGRLDRFHMVAKLNKALAELIVVNHAGAARRMVREGY